MTKVCRVCETRKSVEDFKRDRSRRDGRKSVCRECNRKIDAEYCSRTGYYRKRHLRRTYGLSAGEWREMFAAQDFRCAICSTPEPGYMHGWHTDHDHATGAIRGILCHRCNVGVGWLEDTEWLARATRYVMNE